MATSTGLAELGYDLDQIESDYDVWTASGSLRAAVVGFGSRRVHDLSTATVAVDSGGSGDVARDRLFQMAEALAAPLAILDSPYGGEFFDTARRLRIEATLDEELVGLRNVFGPESLLAAKLGQQQLSLFPTSVSLLTRARVAASERLSERMKVASAAARAVLEAEGDVGNNSHLAITALATLFIEDRMDVPMLSEPWQGMLQSRFPSMAAGISRHTAAERRAFLAARTELRDGVTYRSLDPVVVSEIYESSLVEHGAENENGVVYTPIELAQRMLAWLPLEEIAPEQRRVLDPACGSGTLLLAAHERMTKALPYVPALERHRYLVDRLTGWDLDGFAVDLAHLSLTLHSFPYGNGWNVQTLDTLKQAPPQHAPTLIISNPPWKSRRSEPNSRGGRSRTDSAVAFIDWVIDAAAPRACLGVIVPGGWLTADYARESRRRLQDECDLLEVWRFPERTFRSAEAAPGMILARKRAPGDGRDARTYIARRIEHREALKPFYTTGRAERAAMMNMRSASGRLNTIERMSDHLRSLSLPPLSDVARVASGPPQHSRGRSEGGRQLWLRDVRRMPPMGLVRRGDLERANYPEDFSRSEISSTADFARSKVLITAKKRPDSPWRFKAGLDLLGVIPSSNQYMILPRLSVAVPESRLLDAILAWFSSLPVGLWIYEQSTTGNNPKSLIEALPFPTEAPQLEDLAAHGRALRSLRSRVSLSSRAKQLDDYVFELLRCDAALRTYAVEVASGHQAPEGVARYASRYEQDAASESAQTTSTAVEPASGAWRTVSGCVVSISGENVTLWAPGLKEDGLTVPLPPRFPGALASPGATFTLRTPDARVTSESFAAGEYDFHLSAWMKEEELFASASDLTDVAGEPPVNPWRESNADHAVDADPTDPMAAVLGLNSVSDQRS